MRRMAFVFLMLATGQLIAQEIPVTGRVLSLDNVPAQGVNVILKGTARGTVTDMNGNFRILLPEGPGVLVFIFLKQKPVEHALDIKRGLQYQVNVVMAHRSQTFNKTAAVTGSLPLDAPVLRGRVVDHDGRGLGGANITQSNNYFRTVTDGDGKFALPLADGESIITFDSPGTKDLDFEISARRATVYDLEVVLIEDRGKNRHRPSSARMQVANTTRP